MAVHHNSELLRGCAEAMWLIEGNVALIKDLTANHFVGFHLLGAATNNRGTNPSGARIAFILPSAGIRASLHSALLIVDRLIGRLESLVAPWTDRPPQDDVNPALAQLGSIKKQ